MQLAQVRSFDPNPAAPEVVGDVATIKGFEAIFNNVVYIALGLAGLTLLIMLFMGGFQMLTAGGEAPKVDQARKTLTAAIAGLVLVVMAYFIISFIANFTGVDVTIFKVTQP